MNDYTLWADSGYARVKVYSTMIVSRRYRTCPKCKSRYYLTVKEVHTALGVVLSFEVRDTADGPILRSGYAVSHC